MPGGIGVGWIDRWVLVWRKKSRKDECSPDTLQTETPPPAGELNLNEFWLRRQATARIINFSLFYYSLLHQNALAILLFGLSLHCSASPSDFPSCRAAPRGPSLQSFLLDFSPFKQPIGGSRRG
jgi:hypothetical protein